MRFESQTVINYTMVYFKCYISSMTLYTESKINHLLASNPQGVVLTSAKLDAQGFSHALQHHYEQAKWLRSIGVGAYIRTGDDVDIFGGLYGLDGTSAESTHIAGRTALQLLGRAQYLEEQPSQIVLMASTNSQLPKWFRSRQWRVGFSFHTSNFLPADLDIEAFPIKQFSVSISGVARAMLECCYLAPNLQELSECYELMEGLNNLHPTIVQSLLEQSGSIKAKRLFLFLADHFQHAWFDFLDPSTINLGKGKRQIATEDAQYDSKYQITVPKEWRTDGE